MIAVRLANNMCQSVVDSEMILKRGSSLQKADA